MAYQEALSALADPTRRRVFELIRPPGKSVAQIAGKLPVSRPAVSQHLKVLLDAGLASVEIQGTRHIYAIHPEGLVELRKYFDRFWDDVLERYAEEASRVGRGKGGRSERAR